MIFTGPLYEQIDRTLRSRILSGEWQPNALLPGDVTLSREFGVSIGTIRKAMDQLARDHLIVRERGRGTFVKGAMRDHKPSCFRLRDAHGAPITPQIEMLDGCLVAASPDAMQALQIRARQALPPRLIKLRRRWSAGGLVVCHETIMVEEARFPRLLDVIDPSENDLFAVYALVYRIKIGALRWAIGRPAARLLEPATCDDEPSASTICLTRTALDQRGLPFEISTQCIMTDHCVVEILR